MPFGISVVDTDSAGRSANGGFLPLALPCHGACGLVIVKGEIAAATAPKEPPLTITRPRGIKTELERLAA